MANCLWLWRAFQELQTCRAVGFGALGPIPLTAVWEYVDRYGLPDWTIDALFTLDATWRQLERQGAPAPANDPAPQPRQLTGARRHG